MGVGEYVYEDGVPVSLGQLFKRQVLYVIIHVVHVRRAVQLTAQTLPDPFVIFSRIKFNDHYIGIHWSSGHCSVRSHPDRKFNVALQIQQIRADSRIVAASYQRPVRTAQSGGHLAYSPSR